MLFLLLSLFTMSLIYLALYQRVKKYIVILSFQGVLLTIISIFLLSETSLFQLLFVILETFIVKAVAIPIFLNYLLKRNSLRSTSQSKIQPFISVLIIFVSIIFGYLVSYMVKSDLLQKEIFAVSIICIISGMLFVITHLNIFTHLIGYLVLENGVFLLSMALGSEMPMMVNLSILLDVFVGVLVLGIFINRIGEKYKKINIDELVSELVD